MVLNHQKFEFKNKSLIEKVVIQAPFRFVTNFQDEACFIYFIDGNTTINSPGEQKEINANESVLLRCGSYFSDMLENINKGKYEILVFHLYPDILREIYSNEIPAVLTSSQNKSFIHKIAKESIIKKFIESLYFYFDNPILVSEDLLELKIKELILLLIQTKNADSIKSLFSDLFSPRDVNIKEIIANHIFSNLSIEDLAALSSLSLSTFNRLFQSLFNDTPANYIKTKRLEKAKDLLIMSQLTISEIAVETCFTDVAHLSRSFKAAYSYSPSEYRLLAKKNQRAPG